jgi:predicted RNA-binding protein with PUA-like domain
MNYFLVKADPDSDYGIDDLKRDGTTIWDGVHNNAAILHIRAMKPGDKVYVYHSQKQKSIVGLAEVVAEPFENTADPRRSWAVKLKYVTTFTSPISLNQLKAIPELQDFSLIRIGRLSVMPVAPKHQAIIEGLRE